MNIDIGGSVLRHRKKRRMSQTELAKRLAAYGIGIKYQAVAKWEKNLSVPNAVQFIALCDIFDIRDPLWEFAGLHRGPLSGLNEFGRREAKRFIDILFHVERYRDDPRESHGVSGRRLLRLYDIAVSARTGSYLDESSYELIEAPDYVPGSAEFALRISGDSMKPLYQDRQVVWVRGQSALDSGDIGIFYYRDNSYCKRLIIGGSKEVILRSLNSGYEDIVVGDESFKVIGKVVA